jgi:hypothetical protein
LYVRSGVELRGLYLLYSSSCADLCGEMSFCLVCKRSAKRMSGKMADIACRVKWSKKHSWSRLIKIFMSGCLCLYVCACMCVNTGEVDVASRLWHLQLKTILQCSEFKTCLNSESVHFGGIFYLIRCAEIRALDFQVAATKRQRDVSTGISLSLATSFVIGTYLRVL